MPEMGAAHADQVGNSKFINFLEFEKMNTKVARQNLSQKQAAWMENLQPIAPNNLQTVPAPATSISTVSGKTVARQFPATINGIDYIMFCSTDGNITAVNASNGTQNAIVTSSNIFSPDLIVFSSSILLIMSTAGYLGWNGTLIAFGGTLSLNFKLLTAGSGYTSAPSIAFSGGHGSGATATATVSGGVVTNVTMTALGTGYQAGDVITVTFSGGGATTQATGSIVIWPFISGTSITIFAGRVWWANGRILNFTGTGASTGQTYDDINPSDAAGSTTITDADLVHSITAVRSLNNFLYIFGDQSVKQIGSITVQSSVTLFTILTLASDIGTSFLMTILSYNRLVLFANKQGVYGIFGATVQKISDDLDGIFTLVDFSQQPSSSLQDLTNIHCYMLLVKYNDPVQGPRSIMCVYQSNKWYVVSQGSLLAICGIALASTTQWDTFGSSGADVTELLQTATINVSILLRTALTSDDNYVMNKKLKRSGISLTSQTAQTVTMTVDTENNSISYTFTASSTITWINNNGQTVQWVNNSAQAVNFITGGFRFPYQSTEGYGKFIGNTVTGSVQGLVINGIVDEYEDADLWSQGP